VKFLIDECLSPRLSKIARERGFPASTHVVWLGMRSSPDWRLVRRAVDDKFVLVTHNSKDFKPLVQREPFHPGLICLNVKHGLMDLDLQMLLFMHALTQFAGFDLAGRVMEVTLTGEGTVRVEVSPSDSV